MLTNIILHETISTTRPAEPVIGSRHTREWILWVSLVVAPLGYHHKGTEKNGGISFLTDVIPLGRPKSEQSWSLDLIWYFQVGGGVTD